MSTRFIPGGASEPEPRALEAQQALLVDALRRAGGKPVSYAELRAAGIELPASVVSELELAGLPIERCLGGAHGERRLVGVRLAELPGGPIERAAEPAQERAPAPAQERAPESERVASAPISADGWSPLRVYRTSPLAEVAGGARALSMSIARHARKPPVHMSRLVAPVALGVAVAIVAVLVLTGVGGGATRPTAAVKHGSKPKPQIAATSAPVTTHAAAAPTATIPTTPVSPALATQLESQGHSLLDSGRYSTAVPVLRRAVAATGKQQSACLEPASSDCLTYAYALYDLGRALQLSGHSSAAVPVLEARLQIDNQRPVVAAELQLARQQAG